MSNESDVLLRLPLHQFTLQKTQQDAQRHADQAGGALRASEIPQLFQDVVIPVSQSDRSFSRQSSADPGSIAVSEETENSTRAAPPVSASHVSGSHDLGGGSMALCPIPLEGAAPSAVQCRLPRDFQALEWLLDPAKPVSPFTGILAHLVLAEAKEVDPHLRDDYRQAWITLRNLEKGIPQPFVNASYTMYGLHPDKLFPALTERRKAQLGREYPQWYDENGNRQPEAVSVEEFVTQTLVPSSVPAKKPVQSEPHSIREKEKPAAA